MKRLFVLWFVFNVPFNAITQNRFDVIIDEVMADPTPVVGLPNNEWIELKNVSSNPVNLLNWRIGDASSLSGPFPAVILQPDSFIIVCSQAALSAMSGLGAAIAVNGFPSLDNDGEVLYLRSAGSKSIHAVAYTLDWYRNELKQEGGWSLEMIDTNQPCTGETNWKASADPTGGTAGKKNSIDGAGGNQVAKLLRAYTTNPLTIILVFDQTIDSLSVSNISNYTVEGLNISQANSPPPLFKTAELKTSSPMIDGKIYTITANNIKDCRNNLIEMTTRLQFGLSSDPAPGEWIINEILFNPRPNAFDFVEFYNNSDKIFDVSKLFIANRNSAGIASSIKPLATTPFFIFPREYLVVTENKANLSVQYLVRDEALVFTLSSMPSFPDDAGKVLALNSQGTVVDEVPYLDDWHFKLIDDPEGISLERMDPRGASKDAANWHSAASTAGFATPGYKNSQYHLVEKGQATVSISPKIFSPDNDGYADVASLQYTLTKPGFLANIIIYDPVGRPVRHLVRNETMGLSGYWNWDGLDDRGRKLPVGIYIFYCRIFNLEGENQEFKKTIILARRLD